MQTRTNYLLDAGILAAYLLATNPFATGIAIHEWLSVGLAVGLAVHAALHWEWAINLTKYFFKRLLNISRLSFVVDVVLFLSILSVMVSGFAVSHTVLPALGIEIVHSHTWGTLHSMSAAFALGALGIHLGLHWRWITSTTKSLFTVKQPETCAVSNTEVS